CRFLDLLVTIENPGVRRKALEVSVLNDDTDVHIVSNGASLSSRKMQHFVGLGVRRKPILPVYLFTPSGKSRKQLLVFLEAHRFPMSLDDLEIPIVDPNPALEISLIF